MLCISGGCTPRRWPSEFKLKPGLFLQPLVPTGMDSAGTTSPRGAAFLRPRMGLARHQRGHGQGHRGNHRHFMVFPGWLGGFPPGERSTKRMSWAAQRQTRRREDTAYCLLGIFDITMPMVYGEGDRARLQREIMKNTRDDSILAWDLNPSVAPLPGNSTEVLSAGIFASKPSQSWVARALFRGNKTCRTISFYIPSRPVTCMAC
jgi:hypothetical protein